MNPLETRQVSRERVLMLANVKIANSPEQHRVRIRDLSAQGAQAEGDVGAQLGDRLEVDFGAAGKPTGVVTWCDGTVLGLKFEEEIEPAAVRRAIIVKDENAYRPPWYVRGLEQEKDGIRLTRKV